MATTTKTLRGKIDGEHNSDRGGWVHIGGWGASVSYYFRWVDCPDLSRNVLPNTTVEFELSEHHGRPVAVKIRKIMGAIHA